MKYVIDGLFLTQKITGIQRYAIEIIKEIDKLAAAGELEIVIPQNTDVKINLNNIAVVHYGNHSGILWEQYDLAGYLRRNDAKGIFLCNSLPILWPKGIITIHDVCCKAAPQFFKGLRSGVSALWHRLLYYTAAHSDVTIITDSEFSKSEIEKYYGVDPDRISIIYCGWQHMLNIEETDNVFDKYSDLEPYQYFFSMASVMPNKNYYWLFKVAEHNPGEMFAVAGGSKVKSMLENGHFSVCRNIRYLGYVSDSDAKALMRYCRAFVFPSLYEGFGLPPLEAAATGCRYLVLSEIPVLQEIYGNNAFYVDPNDNEQNVDMWEKTTVKEELLDRYSWKKSAKQLYDILNKEQFNEYRH